MKHWLLSPSIGRLARDRSSLYRIAVLIAVVAASFEASAAETTGSKVEEQSMQVYVGRRQTRALWRPVVSGTLAPAIIMIPGSGSSGPEEMIPASLTADNQQHALFSEFAEALGAGGVSTLAVGKPGVEFHSDDPAKAFYDKAMYTALTWNDLLEQVNDDVVWLKQQPGVDPARIYLFGHSEGTQVAVDFAAQHRDIAGVILLGYAGQSLGSLLDWQLFQRPIDWFVAPDVDMNHDGVVSKSEAQAWPEFHWSWQSGETMISYADMEKVLRETPELQQIVASAKKASLYSGGIFDRPPIYDLTAALSCPVFVFNGELDLQTSLAQVLPLKEACARAKKSDCRVTVVPGVGHGFSPPRLPRGQPYLDITLGPPEPEFLTQLTNLSISIRAGDK